MGRGLLVIAAGNAVIATESPRCIVPESYVFEADEREVEAGTLCDLPYIHNHVIYNSCVEIEGRSRCPLRVGADRTTYNDTQWADCKCGFYNCIIETPNIYSKLSPGTPCEFPFTSYGSNLEFQGCAKSSDGTSWCPAGIDDDGSFAWGNYGTCSCTLSATPWPSSSSGSNDGSESVESSIGSGDKTGSGSAVMGIVIATCIAICVMKIYRKRVINPVNMTELNSQGTVGEKSITTENLRKNLPSYSESHMLLDGSSSAHSKGYSGFGTVDNSAQTDCGGPTQERNQEITRLWKNLANAASSKISIFASQSLSAFGAPFSRCKTVAADMLLSTVASDHGADEDLVVVGTRRKPKIQHTNPLSESSSSCPVHSPTTNDYSSVIASFSSADGSWTPLREKTKHPDNCVVGTPESSPSRQTHDTSPNEYAEDDGSFSDSDCSDYTSRTPDYSPARSVWRSLTKLSNDKASIVESCVDVNSITTTNTSAAVPMSSDSSLASEVCPGGKFGCIVIKIDKQQSERIGLRLINYSGKNSTGVRVVGVNQGSAGSQAGVHEGDIIIGLNDKTTIGLPHSEVLQLIAEAGDHFELHVKRFEIV